MCCGPWSQATTRYTHNSAGTSANAMLVVIFYCCYVN